MLTIYNTITSATTMRFTQFIYGNNEGMVLRSGTSINCLSRTQLWKDAQDVLGNTCGFDKLHSDYCAPCKRLFSLLDFLETHYKEIKGEEVKIHGNGNKAFIHMHSVIRDKLAEFIEAIETKKIENCYCDELDRHGGQIYDNICYLQDLAEEEKYSKMANYKGYGKNREFYRIYHKNFFVYDEPGGYRAPVIGRDFDKIKEELQHWHKYFSTPHHSVVLVRQALEGTLKINSDCIGEIMSFL